MAQYCIEEAVWERYRVISTPPDVPAGERDEVVEMGGPSPGEIQAAQHAARMASRQVG